MFARVLTVVDSRADRRDALVLGAQLTGEDGALLVAHVLQTDAAAWRRQGHGSPARRTDRLQR